MTRRPDDYAPSNPRALEGTFHTLRVGTIEPPDALERKRDAAKNRYLDAKRFLEIAVTVDNATEYLDAHSAWQAAEAACKPAHRGLAANDDGAA